MSLSHWMKRLLTQPVRVARTLPVRRSSIVVECLEGRITPTNIAVAVPFGSAPVVRVIDATTLQPVATVNAYDAGFLGGVNVAQGDVTGDGVPDFITGTATGGSHVKVFDGTTFAEVRSFLAFDGFLGGVNVSAGDVDGDGQADIAVSTAAASSHVKVFSGADGSLLNSFLAYPGFSGGVNVALGDVDGDGKADIVTGAGPGGSGHVKTFSGDTGGELYSFFAYPGFNGGVSVAVGDLDGDGKADIVTGSGAGAPGGHVKAFSGATGAQTASLFAYDAGFTGGVVVGVGEDGTIVTGAVGTSHVKTFDGETGALLTSTLTGLPIGGGIAVPPSASPAPTISSVAPASGPAAGGTTVVITGTNLTGATAVTFGGVAATSFTVDSATQITAVAPAGTAGTADVVVTTADGTATATAGYTYDNAPVITSNGGGATAAVSAAENQTAVTTVTATDADAGATLTYSITGGADAALFTIDPSTGVLTFLAAPDFETPADAGTDNVYDVTVQVSDGTLTDTQGIAVTVTGVNEAPAITSNGGGATAAVSAAENQTAVTTVTATDADAGATLTYSITGGADAALFTIDPSTGVLTFLAAPDFETPADAGANNVYDVTVQVSDGTNTDTQGIAVTVTDVNDNTPTITSDGGGATAAVSAAENQTAVTTVTATDADAGATLTYSITGGADAALFTIDPSTGVLTFLAAPDFETPADAGANNVYDVTVQVSDGTNTDTQDIAVTVTDVNDNTPTITSDGGGATAAVSAAENQTAVTTVTATDADAGATLTYSITGGADAALFTIDPSTGVLTFLAAPDFETPADAGANNVYDVTVQVSDGTNTDTQGIAVTVTDVNDNTPTITSDGGGATAAVSAAENQTAVTTVTATDADAGATLTYSITGGADAALFTIDPSTGVLTFLAAPDFETPADAGANNVYDVTVQVSDGTNTDTQDIAVTVTDVNDNTPTITSDGGGATAAVSAAENQTAVTTVTATDADAGATLTYSITGGADAALFTIDPSTGVLTFLAAPDFETPADAGANNVYDVTVQVSDGTNTDTQDIAVTVTDVGGA